MALAVTGVVGSVTSAEIYRAEDYKAEVGEVHTELLTSWTKAEDIPAISQAMKDAYKKMEDSGFDMGETPLRGIDGYVQRWDDVVMRQMFVGGDHTANPFDWSQFYGNQKIGYLMMSDANGKAFPLVNGFLDYWANNGHWGEVGYPVSDIFTENGKKVQVFSHALLKDDGTTVTGEGAYPGWVGPNYLTTGDWATDEVKASVSAKFLNAYKNAQYQGFNLGTPHTGESVKLWDGTQVLYQVFFNGDNPQGPVWGLNEGFIMQSAPDKNAYVIKGDMLRAWYAGVGGSFAGAGAPDGDEFEMNGKVYQQFINGYISYDKEDASTAVFTPGEAPKKVPETVGVANEPLTGAYEGKEEIVKQAFVDEYTRLNTDGFYPGQPTNGGVTIMNDSSNEWLGQWFVNGDSTANVLNYSAATLIMMNGLPDEEQTVFTISGSVLEKFIEEGSIIDVGAPISNEFEVEGTVYQNFTYGYMSYPADDIENVTFVAGKTVSETGEISELPIPWYPLEPSKPIEDSSEEPSEKPDEKPDENPNEDPEKIPNAGDNGASTAMVATGLLMLIIAFGVSSDE